MIPLRDDVGAPRLNLITSMLIVANALVFAYELRLGAAADPIMFDYGMVPAHIAELGVHPQFADAFAPLTLLTSLFIHGGWLHIIGNMLYLFIFGPAVEQRMGHARYFYFYLLAGAVAGLAMVIMEPGSRAPVVGASGA